MKGKKVDYQFKVGAFLSYASIFISLLSGLVVTPVIISSLSTSEYGLYSLIGSLVGYLAILESGIGTTVVRYISKFRKEETIKNTQNLFATCKLIYFIITALIIFIGLILFHNIDSIFQNSMNPQELITAKYLFIILLINLAITTYFSLYSAVIVAYEKFIFNKIISILFSILKIICIISLIRKYPSAISLTIITMMIGFLNSIINYIYSKKVLISKFYSFDYLLFKEVFLFTFFNFLQIIIYQLYWKIDELLIGILMSTSAVAIYSIATTLNNFIINFSTAICSILLPSVTQLRDNSKEIVTNFIIKISRIIFILYLLIATGFIIFGEKFIELWVGSEYQIVFYILNILILSNSINIILEPVFVLARASNKHGKLNVILIFTSLLNIVVTIYLISSFKLLGAAIGTGLSIIIGNTLIAIIYFERNLNINMKKFFKEITLEFFPFILILIPIVIIFKQYFTEYINNWFLLIMIGGLFVLIYLCTILLNSKITKKKINFNTNFLMYYPKKYNRKG